MCLKGIPIGIYLVGDHYYAMEDNCPHAGSPLSKGELVGTVIKCPSHGWDYDVRTRPEFMRVTTAGMSESHVHDVTITKEAPNYPVR